MEQRHVGLFCRSRRINDAAAGATIAGPVTAPSATSASPSESDVTLANCADEAIHLPGQIPPHGTLLAFDHDGRLVAWAANGTEILQLSAAVALGDALPVLSTPADRPRSPVFKRAG